MERLTQTSDKGGVAFTFDLDVICQPSEMKKILKIAEKLKEYEDLEEQGLLLRLYCNVGDTVYCIEDKKIWDCIVDKVTISRTNGVWFEVKTPKSMPDISAIEYTENAFGETVFLTQAEAELKLKEMESELYVSTSNFI